jgi:hypothetical protein
MPVVHFHPPRPVPSKQVDVRIQLLWSLAVVLGVCLGILAFVELAYGGGPAHVAGASYFDPGVKGQPLAWAAGNLAYYTDQGDLSPLLPSATADSFVADAFQRWTSVSTAALSATRIGQLGEDVNGANVTGFPDGTYTIPPDIQPTATDKPIGVVYDADGAVTNALLGQGAGDAPYCFTNAVFGGPDAYSTDGHLAHALVVLNGVCARTSAALPDVKYRLVRTIGRVIGLDWSQLNNNVLTRQRAPTSDDYAGFPLMHNFDPPGCMPISRCLPDADSLKMDDRAAVSRLYPVTPANISQFPGKQILATNTGRIHGSVYFSGSAGAPGQPMTGVNVIARRIDTPGQPSRQFAASSVSGFAYAAVVGNIVNGYTNPAGQRLDRFGVNNSAWEGFFDLAGLEIPAGTDSAQYQLSVEPLDNYSTFVGPYAPWQVQPSGTFDPVMVTLNRGSDIVQDLVLRNSSIPENVLGIGSTYNIPAPLPKNGEWAGWITGSTAHFFKINALANRTLSIELTALDERGVPAQNKMLPVAGMWALADGSGAPAPAQSSSAFNTSVVGLTRLDAAISSDGDYRIAIADQRGDARPDFRYRARVLYGHTVSPTRAGLEGGAPLTIRGTGFRPGLKATVGGVAATVLANYGNELIVALPKIAKDGKASVLISDSVTGSFTTMTDALLVGADATDNLQLLATGNPLTPVGTEAANPMHVRVTDVAGAPVEGATIVWDGGPTALLTACNLQRTCTVFSNENGEASTRIMPMTTGTSTITATLAPASYSPAKSVQTVVQSAMTALDIGISPQYQRVPAGSTFDATLTVRVVGNGLPLKSKTVALQFVRGSGTLTPAIITTDASGYASTVLHVANASGDTNVAACVSPANTVCRTFEIYSVTPANLRIQPVSGARQVVAGNQAFAPFTIRVTDASTPPNPVRGAAVAFDVTWLRPVHADTMTGDGDSASGHHPTPVVLGRTVVTAYSDANGLVSVVPMPGSWRGSLEADITAMIGTARMDTRLLMEAVPFVGAAASVEENARISIPSSQGIIGRRNREP